MKKFLLVPLAALALTSCNDEKFASIDTKIADNKSNITSLANVSTENRTKIVVNATEIATVADALAKVQTQLASNTSSIGSDIAVLNEAVAVLAMADADNKAALTAAIKALSAKVELGFTNAAAESKRLQFAIMDVKSQANAKLAKQQAEFDAYKAETSAAIDFLSAKQKKKLMKKLAKKSTKVEARVANQMYSIEKANKNLNDKIARANRAVARAEKKLAGVKPNYGQGWFFESLNDARMDEKKANKADKLANKKAELAKVLDGKSVYDARMAEDKEDIARLEAKVTAIAEAIEALTL